MIATRIRRTTRALVILAAGFLFAAALQATDIEPSGVGKGFSFAYDPAKEVTVEGIVEEIVTHPASGSAVGTHLLISSEGKTIDAHLGPFFSPENREALAVGEAVQVVGVNAELHGQNLFLARQLTIGERQIAIRNHRGFLVRPVVRRATPTSKPTVNGGAQ